MSHYKTPLERAATEHRRKTHTVIATKASTFYRGFTRAGITTVTTTLRQSMFRGEVLCIQEAAKKFHAYAGITELALGELHDVKNRESLDEEIPSRMVRCITFNDLSFIPLVESEKAYGFEYDNTRARRCAPAIWVPCTHVADTVSNHTTKRLRTMMATVDLRDKVMEFVRMAPGFKDGRVVETKEPLTNRNSEYFKD